MVVWVWAVCVVTLEPQDPSGITQDTMHSFMLSGHGVLFLH